MAITKDSWAVLRRESSIAAIPVVGFVCTAATMAAAAGAVWATLDRTAVDAAVTTATGATTSVSVTPLSVVLGIAGYLAVTFVVTFFTAAVVAGAHQALTEGSTSLGRALGAAGRRAGPILGWSLLTGTVGLVLDAIRERTGPLGDIAAGLFGAAWNVLTWLAIPVVVVEGTGPFSSLRRSAELFRRTWGENLVAQGGLGLLSFLCLLPVIGLAVVVGAGIPALGVGIGVVGAGVVLVLFATLGGIFRAALYLYATQGSVADGYAADALAAAFTARRGRRG